MREHTVLEKNQRKTIYLASNLGFSKSQKDLILPKIVKNLEKLGYEVIEPFAANNQDVDTGAAMSLEMAHRISLKDTLDVVKASAILLFLNGEPPDVGVYAEGGMAAVLRKKTFVLRDDFRLCTDCEDFPVNLMALSGLPKEKKELSRHFYTTIEELLNPKKALAGYARGEDVYPYGNEELDRLAEAYKQGTINKIKKDIQTDLV
ncbi:MAG: nucleoside 2-deoxyribosyltransferase [Bdellovibrionales bacterium]|nr:nucleoside 2-deoxyribosyltransferase [Bdellovibrionales bacterium]